jgi:hypothetical protein
MLATITRMSATKVWKIFTGENLYHGSFPKGVDGLFWTGVHKAFKQVFFTNGTANGLLFLPSRDARTPWTHYTSLVEDELKELAARGTFKYTQEIEERFHVEMTWKSYTGNPNMILDEMDNIMSQAPFLCPGLEEYLSSIVSNSSLALREVNHVLLICEISVSVAQNVCMA